MIARLRAWFLNAYLRQVIRVIKAERHLAELTREDT